MMQMSPIAPRVIAEAKPFWEACGRHELVFQKCQECGKLRWPASVTCPYCHSSESEWKAISQTGTVYSYVVFRKAFHPALEENLPYIVAVIDLDDGVTMVSNITGCKPEDVECGMRVRAVWADTDKGYTLPLFELAGR